MDRKYEVEMMNASRNQVAAYGEGGKVKARRNSNGNKYWEKMKQDYDRWNKSKTKHLPVKEIKLTQDQLLAYLELETNQEKEKFLKEVMQNG